MPKVMYDAVSEVALCSVPIKATHELNFNTRNDQINYFRKKTVRHFQCCAFQPRSGEINVSGYVDEINDCNYGFYKNQYKNTYKYYFFWIVNKEYVSRQTTKLTIQLDVFQTWLFDFSLKPCFVERMHVVDDTIGFNTVPEDFELGDYINHSLLQTTDMQGQLDFIIAVAGGNSVGTMCGRRYSGLDLIYYVGTNDGVSALDKYISDLCNNGKADMIAYIFPVPHKIMNQYALQESTTLSNGQTLLEFANERQTVQKTYQLSWKTMVKNFEFECCDRTYTYTPRNNKLYTYPYNFITVNNPAGGNIVLKLENFKYLNTIELRLETVITQNSPYTLTPINYDGRKYSIQDSIQCNGFGLCSWNNDNYANWYAQHANTINAQSLNARASYNATKQINSNNFATNSANNFDTLRANTLGLLGNINPFNPIGSVLSVGTGMFNNQINYNNTDRSLKNDLSNSNLMNTTNYQNTIRSITASVKDASVQPNTCKGDTTASGLDISRDTNCFYISQTTIKPEYAKIIDSYFQMYGYQINQVRQPSFNNRKNWNYVKTIGCNAVGDVPRQDLDEIERLFDNGLTVWHNEQNMYDYDRSNPVI